MAKKKKRVIEREGHPAKKSYKKGDTMEVAIGPDYPENKKLKRLQNRANRQYKELVGTIQATTKLHEKFTKQSVDYAGTLLEIEAEAKQPNFGER